MKSNIFNELHAGSALGVRIVSNCWQIFAGRCGEKVSSRLPFASFQSLVLGYSVGLIYCL